MADEQSGDQTAGRFSFVAKYPSDKFELGLMAEYTAMFDGIRHRPIRLLEIGVAEAGSVNFFCDYFTHPDSVVIGIDLHKPMRQVTYRDNFVFRMGDTTDVAAMTAIAEEFGPFDIVIDDGGHTVESTKPAFDVFFPHVSYGGWYIIEDWMAELIGDQYAGMIDLTSDLATASMRCGREVVMKSGRSYSTMSIRKDGRIDQR